MLTGQEMKEPLLLKSPTGDNQAFEDEGEELKALPHAATIADLVQPSARVQHFLQATGLTTADLIHVDISIEALNQLLDLPLSRRALRWLVLEDTLLKLLLYPLLDERGINVDHPVARANWRKAIGLWCARRVSPRAMAIPFQSEAMLKRAYGVTGFFQGAETWITKVWSAILFSCLSYDIYFYYAFPDERYDTTLASIFFGQADNTKSVVASFTDIKIWPELFAFPIAWGIYQAISRSCYAEKWETATVQNQSNVLQHYQPSVWQDIFSWVLPCNPLENTISAITRRLLWDNRLSADDRKKLFTALQRFVRRSRYLSQLQGLSALGDLAYGVSIKDFERLHRFLIPSDQMASLLATKAQAFEELTHLAKRYYLAEQNQPSRTRKLRPLVRYILANYMLWCLGQSHSNVLPFFFWLFKGVKLYARFKLYFTIYEGLYDAIDRYLQKKECEAQEKQWVYLERAADYDCTFCGDEPYYRYVYYKSLFKAQDCLKDYLSRPQTLNVTDFVRLFQRVQPSDNITVLDFSKQDLSDERGLLANVLPVIVKQIPGLQVLRLNTARSGRIGLQGVQYIAQFLTEGQVRYLDLTSQSLGDNGTLAIGRVLPQSKLRTLILDDNNIGDEGAKGLGVALPHSQLQALNLAYNKIGDEGAKELASGLPNSKLKVLYLLFNNISAEGAKGLATTLPNSKLEVLDLSSNEIGAEGAKELASGLPNSRLQSLSLSGNTIGIEGAKGLAVGLSNSQLQSLDLGGNNVCDEGAKVLAAGLVNSKLQSLGLSDNTIGDEGAKELAAGLPTSQLQLLDLMYNNIGAEGAKGLASGLPNSRLQALRLNNNNIGDEGTNGIAAYLPNSQLQSLRLEKNTIGNEGAKGLATTLPNSKLEVLDLSFNEIGAEGAKSLAAGLLNSQLQSLNLGDNTIGDEGAKGLASGLLTSQLQELNLGGNTIGAEGAKGLASGLPTSQLQVLDLGGNTIGNEGAKGLAAGLHNSRLKSLHLGGNTIGAEGAKGLAAGLPNSQLQSLNLRDNTIGDEGAKGLASGLLTSQLQELNLGGNTIGAEGAKGLAVGLPNSQLRSLNLGSNTIGDEGAEAIAQVLTKAGTKSRSLFIISLDPNMKKVLAQAEPNTLLTSLWLNNNHINTTGAFALCRVVPQTDISVSSLGLHANNPIDSNVVDVDTCYISAASSHKVPWPFRMMAKAYGYVSAQMGSLYQGVKTVWSGESKEVAEVRWIGQAKQSNANLRRQETYPVAIPAETKSLQEQTSILAVRALLTGPSTSHKVTPAANPVPLPALSMNEKLIAAQWGFHYLREAVNFVAEYSPFTLPWNRAQKLSAETQQQLQAQEKQLQALEQIVATQKSSRTGRNPLFNDKFILLEKQLATAKQTMATAFKAQKISSSDLKAINTSLERTEKTVHELSKANKQLKHSNVKIRRTLSRAANKNEPLAVVSKHDPVNNTCSQEVLKLNTFAGQTKFGALQQFWSKNASSPNRPEKTIVVTQSNQSANQSLMLSN